MKWIHGDKVNIDDNMIKLVCFLGLIDPHKTRFCAEIIDYLLAEPRDLPQPIYIELLMVDPGRLYLFVEKYYSDDEKDFFKEFMTRPEHFGREGKFADKIIVYDNPNDHGLIDDFLASSPNAWIYICDDLPQLTNAKNIIVDFPIVPDDFYRTFNISSAVVLSKQIGDYFLSSCDSLTRIILHDSVEHLGNGFLFACMALTQVEIPKSVIRVENNLLSNNISLVQLTIPIQFKNKVSRSIPNVTYI